MRFRTISLRTGDDDRHATAAARSNNGLGPSLGGYTFADVNRDTAGARDGTPDPVLVTRLLQDQVPELAGRQVRQSPAVGSSNWVFRVGDGHAVRLPRSDAYAVDLLTEARWLPCLSPLLKTPVPNVEFLAEPSALFPRPWTLVTWLPGENPKKLDAAGQMRLARSLGRFMLNLHDLDTFGLDPGAQRWGYRAGEPVNPTIDAWVEDAAQQLAGLFDPSQVRKAWRRLREVPAASGPPCWVHTDLSTENLLVAPDGQLVGVVDFGGLGIGDRSVDLLYAWSMFDQPAREVLRSEAQADEPTWRRARAWAFVGPGLSTICSYRDSMPARTETLITMVEAVSEEVGVPLR